jgi:hypothetical protein
MGRGFVIFAPSFDEDTGGFIALHRLCDLLNGFGHRAWLWPEKKPLFDWKRPLATTREIVKWPLRQWLRPQSRYRTWPAFRTPIASRSRVRNAVVVYPEIIHGNPLRGRRVVRWLLHKPGFHAGTYDYGPSDRYFFYQKAFDDPVLNPDGDNLLRAVWLRDDVYRNVNAGPRQGTCHMLRKGKHRPIVHDVTSSTRVDGLSHAELAAVFNRVQTFISYDLYTMYSQYAALCGCDSIVVPEEGISKEQWYPDPADRYGVAYGFEDIAEARRTRSGLLQHMKEHELRANSSVNAFVAKCREYFPD